MAPDPPFALEDRSRLEAREVSGVASEESMSGEPAEAPLRNPNEEADHAAAKTEDRTAVAAHCTAEEPRSHQTSVGGADERAAAQGDQAGDEEIPTLDRSPEAPMESLAIPTTDDEETKDESGLDAKVSPTTRKHGENTTDAIAAKEGEPDRHDGEGKLIVAEDHVEDSAVVLPCEASDGAIIAPPVAGDGSLAARTSPDVVSESQSVIQACDPSAKTHDAPTDSLVGELVDRTQLNTPTSSTPSLRQREDQILRGKEILFERPPPHTYGGWDNLQWLSFSGERVIRHLHQPIYRLFDPTTGSTPVSASSSPSNEGAGGFWSRLTSTIANSASGAGTYVPRALAVYEQPPIILVLKKPTDMEQVNSILGIPNVDGFLAEEDSVADHYWIVESVVDPSLCKLRLSNLTTVTSLVPHNSAWKRDEEDRRKACFELITPHESIILSAVRIREDAGRSKSDKRQIRSYFADSRSLLETSAVETGLVQAISAAHKSNIPGASAAPEFGNLSWRHQCILGTLHSIVVSSDIKTLEQSIEQAKVKIAADKSGAPVEIDATEDEQRRSLRRITDEEDDQGLTPLYYACLRRSSQAVALLVAAGARADFVPTRDPLRSSLAHVCARNLDSKSLSVLFSSNQTLNTTMANKVDALGRTPMYIAATEGLTASGSSDAVALSRCVLTLKTWGGAFQEQSSFSAPHLLHPVAVLAGRWRPDELSVVLDNVSFRYSLLVQDLSPTSFESVRNGMSISARYQYPLHQAIIALSNNGSKSQQNGTANEEKHSLESSLIRTLRLLLEHSFEPNERLEAAENDPFWSDEYVGHTPLQILASIALSIIDENGAENDSQVKQIHDAAELLVRNGSRLSIDSPPSKRLRSGTRKNAKNSTSSDSNSMNGGSDHAPRRPKLKIDSKEVLSALGGEDRLKLAQKEWLDLKAVDATASLTLDPDDAKSNGEKGTSLLDTDAPGGSNERSCAICWKEFGSMMNRKHRCRATQRYLCDACSGKRIVFRNEDGASARTSATEYRVSDGQFILARIDAAKEQSERAQARARDDEQKARSAEKARVQARLERLEAESASNRESLFGGIMEHATNFVFGSEDPGPSGSSAQQQPSSAARQVDGLSSTLNETRNAMLERGQKIQDLGDKSAKLVDASSDFARMAKELRRKTESQGLFW